MSAITGTWFKRGRPAPMPDIEVIAWAVAATADGSIRSVFDNEAEAAVVAATGRPGEFRAVCLRGSFAP